MHFGRKDSRGHKGFGGHIRVHPPPALQLGFRFKWEYVLFIQVLIFDLHLEFWLALSFLSLDYFGYKYLWIFGFSLCCFGLLKESYSSSSLGTIFGIFFCVGKLEFEVVSTGGI